MFQQFDFIIPQVSYTTRVGDLRLTGNYCAALGIINFNKVSFNEKDCTEFFSYIIDECPAYGKEIRDCVKQHCEKHQTA